MVVVSCQRLNRTLHNGQFKMDSTTAAQELFATYDEGCAPPEWVLDFVSGPLYDEHARKSVCYSMDRRAEAVRKVLTHRQPVNIAMNDMWYDGTRMEAAFGFGKVSSGYTEISRQDKHLRLPPNIAVYCHTPVRSGDVEHCLHVINSVGVALDIVSQPDYLCVFGETRPNVVPPDALATIKNVILEAYTCVLACARDKGLTKIAICHLGGGAFSTYYPGDYIKEVWLPVVSSTINRLGGFLTEVRLLGALDDQDPGVLSLSSMLTVECRCVAGGRVPKHAVNDRAPLRDVLFQNAWDPHSVAGNGNSTDCSLDGWFGRSSAISALTFPPTNPFIRCVTVDARMQTLDS
jgi:hypothetical protein